jgi:4-nitrophenyl phosphatase
MKKYKNLILDMDGVLWLGDLEIDSLEQNFNALEKKGIRYLFATNNSTNTISYYEDKLQNFGINIFPNSIYSSASVTITYLQNKYPKDTHFYAIGSESIIEWIKNAGFTYSEKDANFVVVGLDVKINYGKITLGTQLILGGADFIGTNPDTTYPIKNNVRPGAGSIIASIQASTDKVPLLMGKPQPNIYNTIFSEHNIARNETLIVGDRLNTDILGGHNANCDTALVLTGISSAKQAKSYSHPPTYIFDSLSELIKIL